MRPEVTVEFGARSTGEPQTVHAVGVQGLSRGHHLACGRVCGMSGIPVRKIASRWWLE